MLANVVLANMTVRGWCGARREAGLMANPVLEMQKLLVILDALVVHFEDDIARRDVAA